MPVAFPGYARQQRGWTRLPLSGISTQSPVHRALGVYGSNLIRRGPFQKPSPYPVTLWRMDVSTNLCAPESVLIPTWRVEDNIRLGRPGQCSDAEKELSKTRHNPRLVNVHATRSLPLVLNSQLAPRSVTCL